MTTIARRASQESNRISNFVKDENDAPHWFKPERFLEPEFDAEQYVADLRRYVPLEALSAELEGHLQVLRHRLVEVINEHYADFVSLSSKLVNVDSAVLRMQKPLLEVQEKLLGVRGEVTAALDALKDGLERRKDVASARALLELMQDTAHVMSKVEKLLAEIQAMEGPAHLPGAEQARAGSAGQTRPSASAKLDDRVRMFERLASEVARLNFYAIRGKELQFVEQLDPRMAAAAERLQQLLSQGLTQALRDGNASARLHCLQAFAAVGDAGSAEQVLREVVVAPLVEETISAVQNERRSTPAAASRSGSSTDGFTQVLDRLAGVIERDVGPILSDTLQGQAGLLIFNFVANSVLAEVDAQLATSFPGAYSVGVPEKFVGNYRAAQAFLKRLEGMCGERRALDAFRGSAALASFQDRWKLTVYFGLRFQNIASGLDAAVSAPNLATASRGHDAPNPLQLELTPSLVLYQSLNRCIAKEVWLQPLADKFLRLVLQLLARFATWLSASLDARAAGPAPRPPGADEDSPQPSAQGGEAWAIGAKPEMLVTVRADVDVLLQWISTNFLQQLQQLMPFLSSQAKEGLQAAIEEGCAAVGTSAHAVADAAAQELLEQCSGVLKQLRGITATYRMTTKPAPTKASHYVASILAPLAAFLRGDAAQRLHDQARAQISRGVVAGVTQRFATQAGEMLETLRKTESSLKRLKKSRAGDAAADGPGALSDTDKVQVQLFLDVQEYGVHIAKFGLVPAEMPAYVELWNAVAQAERRNDIPSM